MILRLLLTTMMLMPALPSQRECKGCAGTMPDECGARIGACSESGAAIEASCRPATDAECAGLVEPPPGSVYCAVIISCDTSDACDTKATGHEQLCCEALPARPATSSSCCRIEPVEAPPTCDGHCGLAGCEGEPRGSALPAEPDGGLSDADARQPSQCCVVILPCEWCACCPLRTPRPPESRQTVAVTRAPSERVTLPNDEQVAADIEPITLCRRPAAVTALHSSACASRQAMFCTWLK